MIWGLVRTPCGILGGYEPDIFSLRPREKTISENWNMKGCLRDYPKNYHSFSLSNSKKTIGFNTLTSLTVRQLKLLKTNETTIRVITY